MEEDWSDGGAIGAAVDTWFANTVEYFCTASSIEKLDQRFIEKMGEFSKLQMPSVNFLEEDDMKEAHFKGKYLLQPFPFKCPHCTHQKILTMAEVKVWENIKIWCPEHEEVVPTWTIPEGM